MMVFLIVLLVLNEIISKSSTAINFNTSYITHDMQILSLSQRDCLFSSVIFHTL